MRALRHRLIAALVRALLALGAALPQRHLHTVAFLLARLAWALSPALRAVGHANLARVFPTMPPRARRHVLLALAERLAANAHQCLRLAAGRVTLPELVEIPDAAREILRPSPRGTLVATGHLGNWELLGATLASLGHTTFAVARRTRNPGVAREVTALRRALGFEEIPRGDYAALHCLRALKRGALIGLLCDQASEQSSAELDFLGHPAPTALGPATLARRTGARLVFAHLRRAPDGRHVLECEEITPRADDRDTMREINARLSDAIRADPSSWVWFHNRWLTPLAPARRSLASLAMLLAILSVNGGQRAQPPVFERCPDGSAVEHLQHVRAVRYGPLGAHRADLFLPTHTRRTRTGAVLLLHGGGWDDPAQRRDAVAPLARKITCALAIPVFSADYRLVREGGTHPNNLADTHRAARWLQSHAALFAIDPARLVAVGESAGGTLALLTASTHPPDEITPLAGAINFSGVTDLPALVRAPAPTPDGARVPESLRRMTGASCENAIPTDVFAHSSDRCIDASPVAHADALPRALLIHAVGDHLVPDDQPLRLRDAAARAHRTLDVLRFDASLRARCPSRFTVHGLSPCVLNAAWPTVAAFLTRAAGAQPP